MLAGADGGQAGVGAGRGSKEVRKKKKAAPPEFPGARPFGEISVA